MAVSLCEDDSQKLTLIRSPPKYEVKKRGFFEAIGLRSKETLVLHIDTSLSGMMVCIDDYLDLSRQLLRRQFHELITINMDNSIIILETYQMHNLEFIHSMFAISDPDKIDAFPVAATFLFTMNHAINRVKCENLPDTLTQSAPYKIIHMDSPYPYSGALEKILGSTPKDLVNQMSAIAQHYDEKYPDNSWVKELVKIHTMAKTPREVITSLACVLLILIKTIPKGSESTEKAFQKFPNDMETYFGLKVPYTFDLEISDISIIRKTCDIGDKLSNLIACVLHAKKLGHRSVVSSQATIGHYIEMTWSWYGNRIMKCLSQAEKEVKEAMTPDEMEVYSEVEKTRKNIQISVKSQNAKLEELSKMYRDGSIVIKAVILSQHKDLKDEIERRAAIPEENVKIKDEVTALGLSMIKPKYKNQSASLRNNLNERMNMNLLDLRENLPKIPIYQPNMNKVSPPPPDQETIIERSPTKSSSDDILDDMDL